VVSTTPRPLYLRERPGTHCTGGWVDPKAGLDVCEKSRPTGIRSPDRPARSQSLYRLSYPAHLMSQVAEENTGSLNAPSLVGNKQACRRFGEACSLFFTSRQSKNREGNVVGNCTSQHPQKTLMLINTCENCKPLSY
jgi:hypothetical protein